MSFLSLRLVSAAGLLFTVAFLIFFRVQANETSAAKLRIDRVLSEVSPDGESLLLTLEGTGLSADLRVTLSPDLGKGQATVARFSAVKRIESIFLDQDIALLADSNHGFHVADVSDPVRMEILGSLREGLGYVWDVARAGRIAFVADVNQGVFGIDLDEPGSMKIAFNLPMPGKTLGVERHGETLLVSAGRAGVRFFDIRQPQSPQALGAVETPGFAWQTAAEGDRIYVADGRSGVHLILADSAGQRELRASCPTPSMAVDVAVCNGWVYAALAEGAIQVIDWRDPGNPRVRDRIPLRGSCSELKVTENRLLAAAGRQVYLFDLSLPERPAKLRDYPFSRGVDCLALKDDFLIAGVSFEGLEVIDLRGPFLRPPEKRLPFLSSAESMAILGDSAVVVDGGIREFDLSDPANPVLRQEAASRRGLNEVAIRDGVVFRAAGANGLQIFRPGLTGTPQALGELRTGGNLLALLLDGTRAYLADGDGALVVADVEDPAAPSLLARLPVPGGVTDLALVEGLLYLATNDLGLVVVDPAHPANPEIIFQRALSHGLRDVRSSQPWVALFSGNREIFLLDSSRPRRPRLVTSLRKESRICSIELDQNRLYVLENAGPTLAASLEVYDLGEPRGPRLLARRDMGTASEKLLGVDGRLFLRGPDLDVLIFDTRGRSPLREIGRIPMELHSEPAAWDAPYLYLRPTGDSNLLRVDVEKTADALIAEPVQGAFNRFSTRVFVSGGHFLIENAGGGGLDIYPPGQGVAGPPLASVPLLGKVVAATIADNRLYLAEESSGLRIFSFSATGEVAELARMAFSAVPRKIVVRDATAFLAQGYEGLRIVDLRDPRQPEILRQMELSWPQNQFLAVMDVTLAGDLALVAMGNAGLLVVDAGDLRAPRVVGHLPVKHARQVAVFGGKAFVISGKEVLWLVDVEDPARPVLCGRIDLRGPTENFQAVGDLLYLAEGKAGVRILPLPVDFAPVGASDGQRLTLLGPRPKFPGTYKIEIGNSGERIIKHGAVSLL